LIVNDITVCEWKILAEVRIFVEKGLDFFVAIEEFFFVYHADVLPPRIKLDFITRWSLVQAVLSHRTAFEVDVK